MYKRYLGYTLIAASLAIVGCSSSDDDADPVDMMPVDMMPVDMMPVDMMPVDMMPAGFTPPADAAASVTDLLPAELLNALSAANVTIPAEGNFTIFAPSSEVLTAAQADGTVLDAAALQFHVVEGVIAANPGDTGATALADGDVTTLGGAMAAVAGTTFGGANITAADMFATNGVVHFIDAIATPAAVVVDPGMMMMTGDTGDASCGDPNNPESAPVAGTTYALIAADPNLSMFRMLLESTFFCTELNNPANNWTVFAPNNTALSGFTGTADAALAQNHIHVGAALPTIADLAAADALTDETGNVMLPGLLSAASNRLVIDAGAMTVNGQPITDSVASAAGAYHVITGVLAP